MTTAEASHPVRGIVPKFGFADRIRKVRRDVLRLGQHEFAERLGITKPTYAAWESGRNEPRSILAVARRIEAMSGVPAAWVLGVDSPTLVTSIETAEYLAASSRGAPSLTLVRDAPVTNRRVARRYGSSPSSGCDSSPDVPASARTVNNADAA